MSFFECVTSNWPISVITLERPSAVKGGECVRFLRPVAELDESERQQVRQLHTGVFGGNTGTIVGLGSNEQDWPSVVVGLVVSGLLVHVHAERIHHAG